MTYRLRTLLFLGKTLAFLRRRRTKTLIDLDLNLDDDVLTFELTLRKTFVA